MTGDVALSNFSGVVWTENISCVFGEKNHVQISPGYFGRGLWFITNKHFQQYWRNNSFLTPSIRSMIFHDFYFLFPWRYLPVTSAKTLAIPSAKLHIMIHCIVRSLFNFWIILMWQPPLEPLKTNIFFYGATNHSSTSRHEIIYDYNYTDLKA